MDDDQLRELNNNIKEMLKWIRFSGLKEVKSIITSTLTSDTEKLMYELTDGEASTRDIATKCNVNQKTVSNYWQKWKVMGILEAIDKFGGKRYKKICSLREIGLEIPEIVSKVRGVWAPNKYTSPLNAIEKA